MLGANDPCFSPVAVGEDEDAKMPTNNSNAEQIVTFESIITVEILYQTMD